MRNRALLVIIALSLSLAIGLFAVACGGDKSDSAEPSTTNSSNSDADPPKSEPDGDTFAKIANEACIDSATESGVSEDMAEEYCNCAIDQLLENVDADQLADIGASALSGDDELPPEVEDELMNAVLDCIDKLME